MKIAMVTPHYWPRVGGVERHVQQIATRLAERGHDVDVLTHAAPGRELSVQDVDGVIVRSFGTPGAKKHFAVSPGLWAYLHRNKGRYDVYHAHNYHATPTLAVAIASRRPLVVTPHYHGTSPSRLRRALLLPYRLMGRKVLDQASTIICVTESEAALVRSHFPSIAERIQVVPNGVDLSLYRDAQPFDRTGRTILSVGRLESYKRIDRIVGAVRYLPDDFNVIIVGTGSQKGDLDAMIWSSGLGGRVSMIGRVSDAELVRWYRTADVWVSMSEIEAMSITSLEALASGAYVVLSDIPAHRSVAELTRGSITLIAASAGPEELAQAIEAGTSVTRTPPLLPVWDDIATSTELVYRRAIEAGTCPT